MSTHLSQADVQRLLDEPSPIMRREIAQKLTKEMDNPQLSESELSLAHDIIRLMAKDVELSVRQALAENLRSSTRLPRDIALTLANDIEEVALPILEHSTLLTDEDLIVIVGKGSAVTQEAIARRANISENVSDALITKAEESVIAALMKNNTAHITPQSYERAIERFQKNDEIISAMVKRKILPMVIAERLAVLVSTQLQDYLVSHHTLSPEVASDILLQSRERTVLNYTHGGDERDIEKLVLQMYTNQRLTNSIVLRALCTGDIVFFEMAIAVMANIPLINARTLIHDGGECALKSLYDKSGMPAAFLPVVRVALDVVHQTRHTGDINDQERYRARIIERILTQMQNIDSGDINYLLKKLGDVSHFSAS